MPPPPLFFCFNQLRPFSNFINRDLKFFIVNNLLRELNDWSTANGHGDVESKVGTINYAHQVTVVYNAIGSFWGTVGNGFVMIYRRVSMIITRFENARGALWKGDFSSTIYLKDLRIYEHGSDYSSETELCYPLIEMPCNEKAFKIAKR